MDKIDGYIEKDYKGEYVLYLHYNGVEACFLYNNEDALAFARHFCHKFVTTNRELPGVVYTDDHGWTKKEGYDDSAVVSCVNGAQNIDNRLMSFSTACKDMDIQADFDIYFEGEKYEIVVDQENNMEDIVRLTKALQKAKGDANQVTN